MAVYTLPTLHGAQEEVAKNAARFRVMACGRRFGKTLLCSVIASREAGNGGRAWWIAPTYKQADEGWRCVRELARQLPEVQIREADRAVVFPSGGTIEFRTAEEPNRLRGSGLDLVVMDEAAFMNAETWNVIRPALADRMGRAIFASTPRGRNFFYDVYRLGNDPLEVDWQSWRFPTSANPYIAGLEISEIRRRFPERVYQQEYEAVFLEDEGVVFRQVRECSTGEIEPPRGARYFGFCDLAGTGADYNALAVFRNEGKKVVQVFADRWSGTGFEVSLNRIAVAARRYRGTWALDTTGQLHDDPYLDRLRELGVRARGFTFTRANKPNMVMGLAAMLEQGEIRLLAPESCEAARVQVDEMVSFTAEKSSVSGLIRYGAPSGFHDDTVTACMAAAWMARRAVPRGDTRRALERLGVI